MNFLAHSYLSNSDSDILAGNLMGDSIKGNLDNHSFESGIMNGLRMHRFIDSYSDMHEDAAEVRKLLWAELRHYNRVGADMIFDHILAKKWNYYSEDNLEKFSKWVYEEMTSYHPILPAETRMLMHYMQKHNWLLSYASEEGISTALRNMSRRIGYKADLLKTMEVYQDNKSLFEDSFLTMFESLQREIQIQFFNNG